jgi:hypothetical protein
LEAGHLSIHVKKMSRGADDVCLYTDLIKQIQPEPALLCLQPVVAFVVGSFQQSVFNLIPTGLVIRIDKNLKWCSRLFLDFPMEAVPYLAGFVS